jgi:hypothetical protein
MDHVSFTPGPWTVAEEFLATLPNELAEAPRKDRLNEFRKFVTKLQPDIEAGYLIPDQTSAFLLETATRMCAPDEAPAIEEIVRDMMMPLTFREAEEPPVDRGNVPLVDSLDAYGDRRPARRRAACSERITEKMLTARVCRKFHFCFDGDGDSLVFPK